MKKVFNILVALLLASTLSFNAYAILPGQNGVDGATQSSTAITWEHHEIHEGDHFFICDYILNQAAAYTKEFVITTPTGTKQVHATLSFSASDGATLEVYKGSTSIVGGTPITPLNNNGNSSNTTISTILADPTSTVDGARAAGFIAGGARESGFASREREIILEAGATFLFRITSLAVSNDIGWCFEWYEHTDKAAGVL